MQLFRHGEHDATSHSTNATSTVDDWCNALEECLDPSSYALKAHVIPASQLQLRRSCNNYSYTKQQHRRSHANGCSLRQHLLILQTPTTQQQDITPFASTHHVKHTVLGLHHCIPPANSSPSLLHASFKTSHSATLHARSLYKALGPDFQNVYIRSQVPGTIRQPRTKLEKLTN